MCAQLFSCPLCTRPSFQSLDSLRVGLVSVATRPLPCPVCDETLLGIDKLTIHLFGHTINNASNQTINSSSSENQLEDNTVTIPHVWHVANASIDIDTAPKLISNTNSANFIIENIEKNPDEIVFVNEFLHQSNFIESNTSLPIAPVSMPEASTVPATYNDNTNKIVDDVKLMNMKNSDCMQSENLAESIIKLKRQEENLHNSSSSSSLSSATVAESWTKEFIFNSNSENSLEDDHTNATRNKNFAPVVQLNMKIVSLNVDDKVQPQQSTLHIPGVCHDTTTSTTNDESQCKATALNDSENNERILPNFKGLKTLTVKERTERCNICGFHFPDHNILILHKQLVHMIDEADANVKPEVIMKSYPCHLCPKVFKMRGSLMVHMRVAHSGYNLGKLSNEKDSDSFCYENGFNCPTCGKNFRKEQHVTQHLKTHEGKQWGCEVCSKMFTTKYFLKKHKRLHSGEMPYKCNICNKTFTFQQSYHKHRLYHKDDKPHTCTTCGRSFKELSTLHNHERIHTGEKPFACETCGKCFRQRVSYVVHRRIHTGVMPYCCSACGKHFRYKVSQRTHKCPVQAGETSGSLSEPHPAPVSPHMTEVCNTSPDTINNPSIPISDCCLSPFELPETNKYVLIVNNDGQPLLRRESELNAEDKINNTGDSPKTLSQHKCSDILNESLETNNSEDLFSLIMPTLNTDLSSPSRKMKELRLSSPTNEESFDADLRKNSNLQKDIKHAIDGILQERNKDNNPLQTINEESLKQLLYGIDKKI